MRAPIIIVLLVCILRGGAEALFAGSVVNNHFVDSTVRGVTEGVAQGWATEQYRPVDMSIINGVVTWVDTNRSLAVIQDEAMARAFKLNLTHVPLVPGELVKLQGVVSKLTSTFPAYPDEPDGSAIRADFEGPTNFGQFYLGRLQGILRVPVTGKYTFWIASDDSSELWLGTASDPKSAHKIAFVESGRWTNPRQWKKYPTQQSRPIRLQADVPYYLEALQQQGGGNECLAVAWQGPNIRQSVIPKRYLSPCNFNGSMRLITNQNPSKVQGVFWEYWTNFFQSDLSRLHVDNPTIQELRFVRLLRQKPTSLPRPMNVHIGERLDATNDFRRMELQGTLRFCSRTADELHMELSRGDASVQVVVRGEVSSMPLLPDNSLIRVCGVGEMAVGSGKLRRLLMVWVNSPKDVVWLNTNENWSHFKQMPAHLLTSANPHLGSGKLIHLQGRVLAREGKNLWRLQGDDTFRGYVSSNGVTWTPLGAPVEFPMDDSALAGIAISSHRTNGLATASFDNVRGLSGRLDISNIGHPPIAGSETQGGRRLTIRGSGSDIWAATDQCFFAWHRVDGPTELSVHLTDFSAESDRAKIGLMIRQSLKSDSPWAAMTMLPSRRVGFQARREIGNNAAGLMESLPVNWLKLTRQQNFFSIRVSPHDLIHPGERLDVLGRLGWHGDLPVLENIHFRALRSEGAGTGLNAGVDFQEPKGGYQEVKIRNLTKETEKAQLAGQVARFKIRGVVTFKGQLNGRRLMIIQDSSGGCPVSLPENHPRADLKLGDLVEAIGLCRENGAVPEFVANGLSKIGLGVLPRPQKFPFEPRANDWHHSQWVEIDGVGRSVNSSGDLIVATRGGHLPVVGENGAAFQFSQLVDASVRLRGVYWSVPSPRLLLPSLRFINVVQPKPKNPFGGPVFSISDVRGLKVNPASMHRLKIRGVVTCKRERFFVVQDHTGGVLVRPESNDAFKLKLGGQVEVAGFPTASPAGVMLTGALARRAGPGRMPEPVALPAKTLPGERQDQSLVTIKAVLMEQHSAGGMQYMDLQAGQRVFRANLPTTSGKLEVIAPGSLVRVTGIAQIQEATPSDSRLDPSEKPFVASMELLLRNPNDLSLLKSPPWWNWKYTAGTVAFFCTVLVLAFVWIKTLHRRVEERTHELRETMGKLQKETQISATLAERDRLAGEIHDSVEQGLSAIMLQLDAAVQFAEQPKEVKRFLGLAKNMAGFSRDEVHHVVWGMQSPLLENADLPTALRRVAGEISAGDVPLVTVDIVGDARPLPSAIEHHLLRIGQEAITNAVKHARPKTIRLQLDYVANSVTLTIEDDGCGFDPAAVQQGNGHFGLEGIRTRGRKINASLTILSKPGCGTKIEAKVLFGSPTAGVELES